MQANAEDVDCDSCAEIHTSAFVLVVIETVGPVVARLLPYVVVAVLSDAATEA
jgi:hypothetical protein